MKKVLISLFSLASLSAVSQINLATRPYQDTNIKVLRQIRTALSGTSTVSGSVVVTNQPSVTVLNPSVSIIGTPTVVISGSTSIGSATVVANSFPNSALTVTVFTGASIAAIKTAYDAWRAANPTSIPIRTGYVSVSGALREFLVEFK